MATSKLFDPKLFLEAYTKELPEYQSKALTELDFRQHEERLMALMQSQYAVPKELITGGMRSGRSAAIAELEALVKKRGIKVVRPTPGEIRGKSADWMVIDEVVPVHPNCKSQLIPVGADSRNVSTAHDDMLDALAMSFGLVRTPGETDADFRARVKAMPGTGATVTALIDAVMTIAGIQDVVIQENGDPGVVDLNVYVEPNWKADVLEPKVRETVDEVRPAGVHVNIQILVRADGVSRREEDQLIKRLRSKILERYPDGE